MKIMDTVRKWVGKKGEDGGPQPDVEKSVLIDKIRQTDLFKDLPPENLEEVFSHMETVSMKSGEEIIRDGEEGDYYYLLVSGKADVLRSVHADEKPQIVAELTEPTGFGEEALISNAKRNATVTMTSSGVVMRLSKEAFEDYVKEPMITWVPAVEAQKKVAAGAKWIDVRDLDKSKEARLHGAISLPMKDIRTGAETLDKDLAYVCYCENGRLSSTAVFLLKKRGLDVVVLRGGLQGLKKAGIA